jgi:hypothetical protein
MDMLYEGMVIQDQHEWGDDIAVYKWLGKKVKWGGIEGSKLVWVFHKIAKSLEEA